MRRFLLLLVSVATLSLSLMTSPVDAYPLAPCSSICPTLWPSGRCIDDCTGQQTSCHLNCQGAQGVSGAQMLVLPREEAGPSVDWNTGLMSTIRCSNPLGSEGQ